MNIRSRKLFHQRSAADEWPRSPWDSPKELRTPSFLCQTSYGNGHTAISRSRRRRRSRQSRTRPDPIAAPGSAGIPSSTFSVGIRIIIYLFGPCRSTTRRIEMLRRSREPCRSKQVQFIVHRPEPLDDWLSRYSRSIRLDAEVLSSRSQLAHFALLPNIDGFSMKADRPIFALARAIQMLIVARDTCSIIKN
jgi:hypothetical protein